MARKQKFKPELYRIKLNPEQAILACTCYTVGLIAIEGPTAIPHAKCMSASKGSEGYNPVPSTASVSSS